ncbi:MAG: tRNA (adenosine(37)-N6)-threonylcarbamoyltransferase complex dimerization subunit type 1 TsaB [Burkholderiaceae bacterium]
MKLLAIDTSTDALHIAASDGVQVWAHSEPGGAQASLRLIPAILTLLARAQLELPQLRAIAFGAGPGAFTGLRTACAVAQGLAFGAGIAVLPVCSLLALAESAHHANGARRVLAVLDARMDEVYAASYEFDSGTGKQIDGYQVISPEKLALPAVWHDTPAPWLLAGNAHAVYGPRLSAGLAPALAALRSDAHAVPTALALLRLAPGLLAAGGALRPEQAYPLYVRNRVAQTSAEQAASHQQKAAQQKVALQGAAA